MPRFTKPSICPSRSNAEGSSGLASGYALLFVMIGVTVLLVSLTAVLPRIYQEAQREREKELIFRGTQYARAIAGFHKKFQRYPTSISELTKLTNGFRFLRREFPDPMTSSGKWRYIHANAQGVLLDSKTQPLPAGAQGQPNAGQGLGGFGPSGSSSMNSSSFGQQGMGPSSFGQQGMGSSGFGQSTGGFSLNSTSSGSTSSGQGNSAFFGQGSQGGGMFIVGVASTSSKQSIGTWNKKTHYDEWEFVGVDMGALGFATSIPGLPMGVNAQPGQGNQSSAFGQSSSFGQSSAFGQSSTGNPTAPGQNQGMFPPSGGSSSTPQ